MSAWSRKSRAPYIFLTGLRAHHPAPSGTRFLFWLAARSRATTVQGIYSAARRNGRGFFAHAIEANDGMPHLRGYAMQQQVAT